MTGPAWLRYRLRNAPPVFVGRRAETSWLANALGRAPVTVVWGAGGLGKTALVLHTLHRHFAEASGRALQIDIETAGAVDVRVEVVRALAQAEGWSPTWPDLLQDPEALIATAIDLAERARAWIVIDDLHNADPAHAEDLLAHTARYARESRWVATTRVAPVLRELVGQALQLMPMRDADLERLARDLAPGVERSGIRAALRLAQGSPWRLSQALSGAIVDDPSGEVDVLAGLDDDAHRFVLALSVLERPVPLSALGAFAPVPDERQLARLEARGLIERGAAGVRLHEVPAALLDAPDEDHEQLARAAAGALAGIGEPDATLEALRLLLETGQLEGARALLDAQGRALFEHGLAPELWQLLGTERGAPVAVWRLRAAVQFGDKDALGAIADAPPEGGERDQLAWATALLARRDLDGALQVADSIFRETADPAVRFDAGLLAARTLYVRAHMRPAIERLELLSPVDEEGENLRSALVAVCRTYDADENLAEESARDAWRRLAGIPLDARVEATRVLSGALETSGRPLEAGRVLDALFDELGSRALHLAQGRLALAQKAIIATETGALAEATELLERLQPFSIGVLGLTLEFVHVDLGLASGRLDGLGERVEKLLAAARATQQASHYFAAARLDLQLRSLRGEARREHPGFAELSAPRTVYTELYALRAHALGLLSGSASAEPPVITSSHPELSVMRRLCLSLSALLSGDAERGLTEAEAAVADGTASGFVVYAAEAEELRAAALLVLGRLPAVGRAARDLAARGEAMASARFSTEARFWGLWADPGLGWPEALEHIAGLEATAPVAARRARALLGAQGGLDRLDRLVVDCILGREGVRVEHVLGDPGAAPWQPGWGLDESRRAVWLPDGSLVPLSRRPILWRLLLVLADSGGSATKEQLITHAWQEPGYHPLKHDNRLRLAARQLRRALETQPDQPERLLTTDDGYELAGPVRRLRG